VGVVVQVAPAHGKQKKFAADHQAWPRGHRVEAARLALSVWAVARLAEDEEPEGTGGEAGSGRGLDKMTERRSAAVTKSEAKKTWDLLELHGCWWACEGELPPPEAFTTHGRPRHLAILGPFPFRVMAEVRLQRHLSGRAPEAPANPSRAAPRRGGWR